MDRAGTIQRLLVVGSDDFATQAVNEAALELGLLTRHAPMAAAGAALADFGPDAVLVDTAGIDASAGELLQAVNEAGAVLMLLGSPDERSVRIVRKLAEDEGVPVAGVLAKPFVAEGLAAALRAVAGELVFSAADIANAVMRGEITAWYQLQLSRTDSGWRADSAEALARWQHPEHGIVLPDAFVPVAEAEGQIAAITDCVLQDSVQQLGVWHRAGLELRVGVNLSPLLVTDPDFPDRLARLLLEYDVPSRAVVLEIPEPGLAQAPREFHGMLARLRVHGFGLALEHFGSGNSSLADLYRTPFSELKIDRRLVSLIDYDEDARRLVRGIIRLAQELGLATTAEAVETTDSLHFLHEAGCDRVQGFVISRPLPATELQAVVTHWR